MLPPGAPTLPSLLEVTGWYCSTIPYVHAYSRSQGAAVCHRAIENLPQSVKDRINGVVTFGDTQNQQDRGQIPNFPPSKTRIFCNPGDLVCRGTLTITAFHLTYGSDAPAAANFLAGRIRA